MATDIWIDLPLESGGGGSGVGSLNGLTGALSLIAGNGIDIIPSGTNITISTSLNTPNTIAGFNNSGILESVPGWNITDENGFSYNEQVDELAADYGEYAIDIVPTAPTTNVTRNIISVNTNLDPSNTNFQIGDSFNGGMTSLALNVNQTSGSSAHIGNAKLINLYSNLGDGTVAATMDSYNALIAGVDINNNYTITQFNGISSNAHFYPGSTTRFFNGISSSFDMEGLADGTGGFSLYNGFATYAPTNVTTMGVNGMNMGVNLNGALKYYNAYTDFTQVQSLANLSGGYTGITFQPTFQAGSTINNANFVNINPTGASGVTYTNSNITGVNIYLDNIITDFQKRGMNIDGGSISVTSPWDTSVYPLPSGSEFQLNNVGGQFTVAAGFPVTNVISFGNNFNVYINAQDDMGPDPVGVIGFTSNALLLQGSIASGKTVDTLNSCLAAYLAQPISGDGGTITNLTLFRAAGGVPEGGNVIITNMYGFRADSLLSALTPTNVWGISIEDSNADNYFDKSISIGTVDKKVSSSDVAVEVGSIKAVIPGKMTTTQKLALGPIEGMWVYDITLHQMSYYNGVTWINF